MENHAHDPTVFLKVETSCCEACPKKLKKALLKIDGVYSVVVDPEQELVSVTGKVDPRILIESIEKWGKTAKVLPYGKRPKNVNNQSDKGKCPKHGKDYKNIRQNGKERSRGCPKDESSKKEDNGHKPEAYVAQEVDPTVCRDPYCKLHKRKSVINSKVPSIDSADHPHHLEGSFGSKRGSGSSLFQHGNSFAFDHPRMGAMGPPPMMEPPLRPPACGLHSRNSYMPGFDNHHLYYGDHAAYPRNSFTYYGGHAAYPRHNFTYYGERAGYPRGWPNL